MAFDKEWAQQDLNLRPSDYESEPMRSPTLMGARLRSYFARRIWRGPKSACD